MGIGQASSGLPSEFGPGSSLHWKTPLPPGHSSPVLAGNRIFLTGIEDEKLWTLCLDRETGEILWRKQAPRPRRQPFHPVHGPASPTPATDGSHVYVFFGDFGLISYDAGGEERWRHPLGPFLNANGIGSSPILADGLLILICDQDKDSYLIAVDAETGETRWKTERPEVTRGYATPSVFRPSDAPAQLVVPGSYQIISYELATGKKLWWVTGMCWQFKSVPIVRGDVVYVNGWEIGGGPGERVDYPPFDEVIATHDSNGDGRLSFEEKPHPRLARERMWQEFDLDDDGYYTKRDWEFMQARGHTENSFIAIHPEGATGDVTTTKVLWRHRKALPNVPSPLLYQDVIYLIKDGGILTTLDPDSGKVLKQGRLPDAIDKYWASPVAADGKVYTVNQACTATVLKAGGQWEIAQTNHLEGECFATPAIADGTIYWRTTEGLYAFGGE